MSKKKSTISDYPEHLNPFYEENEKEKFWKGGKLKRSNSFGQTLRNSFLFKSFRPKKKDKAPTSPVALRKHEQSNENLFLQRQTLPPPQIYKNEIPLLPRSRFSERVAHLNLSNENISNDSIRKVKENPPVVEKRKKLRRRKKRAPLPPGVIKEDEDPYLNPTSEHNLSEWSLTSACTDLSAYSESEHLEHLKEDIIEIMNITKELEKMTDNTINNSNNNNEMDVTQNESLPIDDNYNFISEIVQEIIDKSGNEKHAESSDQNSNLDFIHNTSHDATSPEENLTFNEHSINSNNNNSVNENLQISQFNDVTQK